MMRRRIQLTGVPHGSATTLQVNQDGESATQTSGSWRTEPNRWGAPTPGVGADIRLVSRSPLQVAPEGFRFAVDLTGFTAKKSSSAAEYDPQHHDIFYFWDFGDPGGTFDAPENVLDHQRDSNVAYGPTAAHVYEAFGSYTVSVLVIEPSSGKVAQAEFQIGGANEDTPEIQDPSDVFAGNLTAVIDPAGGSGNHAAKYPGHRTYTSLGAMDSGLNGRTGPYRVVLLENSTHVLTDNITCGGSKPSLHFVKDGDTKDTATHPVITYGSFGKGRMFYLVNCPAGRQYSWDGIIMRGNWDDTTEKRASGNRSISALQEFNDGPDYTALFNCVLENHSGHAYLNNAARSSKGARFLFNTVTQGNRSYHIYDIGNGPISFLGHRGPPCGLTSV